MIRVINRKRYNTETSNTIYSEPHTDMGSRNLEITPKGNFFIAFFSGTSCWSESDSIMPVTPERALEFVSGEVLTHEEAIAIDKYLGGLIEDA